jgi:CubicO group peptidase (beta-lactamase class C family)
MPFLVFHLIAIICKTLIKFLKEPHNMKNILLLFCFSAYMSAQAQPIGKKADELLQTYTDQDKFSGAVLIGVRDKVVFNKGYGYANRDDRLSVTTETEFRAGSLTKMFTSTLILKLVQERKIKLSDPVSKYVSGFPNGERITLKNLLSHTSGIRGTTPSTAQTLSDMVKGFKADTLAFKPGEKFEYNNFNYFLLSYIAQKVSGISYPSLLKNKILSKAGMNHSGLDFQGRKSTHKALGYVTNPNTERWVETDNKEHVELASGAGALYTTTGDLWKWSQVISKGQLLSKELYHQAFTPVQPGYGLGWIVGEEYGHFKIGHTGSIPGFIADFIMFPKDSVTIIFLSNYQDLNGKQLEQDLIALVFGKPYELPKQKKEITIAEDSLRRYVGIYEQAPGMQMNVLIEDRKLKVIAPGGDKVELTAEAPDKFFLKGPEIEIKFLRENGTIVSMFVNMQGGQTFKKIK